MTIVFIPDEHNSGITHLLKLITEIAIHAGAGGGGGWSIEAEFDLVVFHTRIEI